MTGRIHSIQSLGTLDGPGVRTVVFLQGCPLRCAYCHNPDTWDVSGGTEITAEAVFDKIRRYQPYYKQTGGVTFSGGEPLLQAAFVREAAKLCRQNGIHVALDTSGCIWNDDAAALLGEIDLALLDVKMTTEETYRRFTGGSLERTMQFLKQLQSNHIKTWVRHVVVPGINDTKASVLALKTLVASYPCVEKIELLPFRKLCLEKYQRLDIPFPLAETADLPMEQLGRLQLLVNEQEEVLTKTKNKLIALDSDGCVYDTMEAKCCLYTIPELFAHWHLEPVRKEVECFYRQYSLTGTTRGANRFITLHALFRYLESLAPLSKFGMADMSCFFHMVACGARLSLPDFQKIFAETKDAGLGQIIGWALDVNARVKAGAPNIKTFPLVRESMEKIKQSAHLAVVSTASMLTLEREWQNFGFIQYPDAMLGHEYGDKWDMIRQLMKQGFDAEDILMVGDSYWDYRGSRICGVKFYPILAGHEAESWHTLYHVVLDCFFSGKYTQKREAAYLQQFQTILGISDEEMAI